jgi:hypothetical protein
MKAALLKIAALFSYCGGPLFVAEILKPRLGKVPAFLVTFLPLAFMLMGSFFLEDLPDRLMRAAVRAGLLGMYLALAMHAYTLWRLLEGVRTAEPWLHWFGMAVGAVWSVVYLRASGRFLSPPDDASPAGDRPGASPIEPR